MKKPSCAETVVAGMAGIRAMAPHGPESGRSYIILAIDDDGDISAEFDGMGPQIGKLLHCAVSLWVDGSITDAAKGDAATWPKSDRN